jgi:hypothetical protein
VDEEQLIYEISILLDKVHRSETLVETIEAYLKDPTREISGSMRCYVRDVLERKRDQIDYEWLRIKRMGQAIASGRAGHWNDALDL